MASSGLASTTPLTKLQDLSGGVPRNPGRGGAQGCYNPCLRKQTGGMCRMQQHAAKAYMGPAWAGNPHVRLSFTHLAQDLPGALSEAQIAEAMGLHDIKTRPWSIFKTSAIKGDGLHDVCGLGGIFLAACGTI